MTIPNLFLIFFTRPETGEPAAVLFIILHNITKKSAIPNKKQKTHASLRRFLNEMILNYFKKKCV